MTDKVLRCGKCKRRIYCSKECQTKDWKEASHSFFCTRSGEIGHDFAIKSSEQKGLGVYALRSFEANEVILAERPFLKGTKAMARALMLYRRGIHHLEAGPAIQALHPVNGPMEEKLKINAMLAGSTVEDGEPTLFMLISRINHECISNGLQKWVGTKRVMVIQANRRIEAGEEISIVYRNDIRAHEMKLALKECYNFDCQCQACRDDAVVEDLDLIIDLRGVLNEYGKKGQTNVAIWAGNSLIQLFDKYRMASWRYSQVYYFMYQYAIVREKTYQKGIEFLNKAYEEANKASISTDDPDVMAIKPYFDNPKSHSMYGVFDKI
jgi:MYND finger/SET domain